MSRIPDPALAPFDLRYQEGGVGRHPVTPLNAGPGRSLLTDLFPTFLPVRCGFEQLTVPDPTVIAANQQAWYGLAKLPIETVFGQDVFLDYVAAQLTPTESAGVLPNVPWGTTSGTGAAIVIGRNLPTELGAWTSAPCYVPGIGATTAGQVIADGYSPYAAAITFPSGEYSDTAPNKPFVPIPLGKVAYRFRRGSTFDIAIVVRGTQINFTGGGNRTLRCHVHVEARLALTQTTEGFDI